MVLVTSVWNHVSICKCILVLNETSEDHQSHHDSSSGTINQHFMATNFSDVKLIQSRPKWRADRD